eukprot:Selendium_serpulae@DN6125_c0_g1_i1.p2
MPGGDQVVQFDQHPDTSSIKIYIDSSVAIKAIERGYSHKLGHVPTTQDISMSWLREVFDVEGRHLVKISTHVNIADLFTKPLGRIKINQFCGLMNLQNGSSQDKIPSQTLIVAEQDNPLLK